MIYLFFLFLNSFFVSKVHAESLQGKFGELVGTTAGGGFEDFVKAFVQFAVPLGVFCALVLLGFAAFAMITSAGNPDKLKDAREIATNAVIGAIMVGMGVIVLSLLDARLGLNIN